jgi:hypothetical protein
MQPVNDPTSLENLHDIVASEPVSFWWPLAPGWWVVLTVGVAICGWIIWRWWRHWRANAYRRAALLELARMNDVDQLSNLLKRVAVAIYPRRNVASLSGRGWVDFINASAPSAYFKNETGELLLSLGYDGKSLTEAESSKLVIAARKWIMGHRP